MTSLRLDEEQSVDDKRKQIKTLIEKIPTVKEDLFAYDLKWDIVDEVNYTCPSLIWHRGLQAKIFQI